METYHGFVRTPADAIKLFEACRLGLLPRVQRRLSEKERQSIRSGSVFVWDEREAGMRRWTDGKSWSASRVSGSFLTYREMEGKRGGGFGSTRRGNNKTPDSGRGSDEDHEDGEPDGYRYKADGLMKQSFSITTSTGQHLHLISYYSRPQPGQADLPQPTNDATLRHIVPVKGMYPESSMGETNQTPALTRAPMQQPPYMMPQHAAQQQYAPHGYGQHGYGWPPSPAVTPPYSHYTTAPYPHQLPHPSAIPPPSQPQYAPPQYEPPHHELPRASLPPPLPQKAAYAYQPQHRVPSPPRLHDPREHELQVAAQAAIGDPRMAGRNPPGPLPGFNSVTSSGHSVSILADAPPPRVNSVSPPRSSHSEMSGMNGQARNSISALLHHTGDSHSAPSNSSADSPRSSGIAAPEKGDSADVRALRMLDRSAFRVPPKQVVA